MDQPLHYVALPLHIQRLDQVLNLNSYLSQLEDIIKDDEPKTLKQRSDSSHDMHFNLSYITPERRWIKDLLLSDTDESDSDLSESEKFQLMLELHYKRRQKWKKRLKRLTKIRRCQYLSAGLLLSDDKYPEIHKKSEAERKKSTKPVTRKDTKVNDTSRKDENDHDEEFSLELPEEDPDKYRRKLWSYISKKEIPKMAKIFSQARHMCLNNNKKVAVYCQREVRRWASKSQRQSKETSCVQPRARRIMKEVLGYWRKYEKVEKEARKKAEKEAQEQQKLYDEMREARRQQRKLNFLITQTELYAHFMSKKLTGEEKSTEDILKNLEDKPIQVDIPQTVLMKMDETDEYDTDNVKAKALANVQFAVEKHKAKHQTFVEALPLDSCTTDLQQSFDQNFSLANPSLAIDREVPQPSIFNGQLKAYQLKGMNWLASLYDQGINGILADEMGLGKTVQSIALLAHLAEHQNIWGPFLIVSPASTLHNWQQECTRFVSTFKVLPYWGNPYERKVIRKYWNQKLLCHRNAPFHVLITSYQLVVQDFKYFQRLKWQYMILDEAQAIKSSSSVRWKLLMSFNCRNRLLLTGTPIQNTMAELWALLHFIMPTMFDSHDEFSEWFSKDIESHAEKKSALDENQLSRLHMILKPFMLRRIKKDVEHEMAEKIEIHLSCGLSSRQRELYHRLKERISIDDLLRSSLSSYNPKESTSTLMNIVMQFRKVCNHPDLFERCDVKSPVDVSLSPAFLPRLIYHDCLCPLTSRQRLLTIQVGVVSAHHAHKSSLDDGCGLWSFLRLVNLSPSEGSSNFIANLSQRLKAIIKLVINLQVIYLQRQWQSYTSSRYQLLLSPSFPLSPFSIANSSVLSQLVFTSHTSYFYAHNTHIVSSLKEPDNVLIQEINTTITEQNNDREQRLCQPTELPKFLQGVLYPKILATFSSFYVSDRSAEYKRQEGATAIKNLIQYGYTEERDDNILWFSSPQLGGLDMAYPLRGWSHIDIPDKEKMITDSDKMVALDRLLAKLKREGHRVLVYSQMTRMIDILEDFMVYRRHKYIRLDGSSRISERRDMVDDFQTKSDIFVFLLSTRAGGLGINLTAADTVIFYDSDWNPTVDQQAMDRAHRLGQTKQVTVYRLIVKGSIEERILQRAHEKSEIQKMVISGGDFKIDTLKPKEVVSLLLDDEEMETRFLTKQAEKKAQDELTKQKTTKTRKRKNTQKIAEGTPSSKKAPPTNSISPSPSLSRPGSVTSNDVVNGEYIDVVGGGGDTSNEQNTPKRRTLGKRNKQGGIKRQTKKPKSVGSTPTRLSSKSPSIPASPTSLLLNNGTSSHSSPRISPNSISSFLPSTCVTSSTLTPPTHSLQ